MKYTIELTDNQKKQMDFMLDMANKHMGFNRKLEMIKTTNIEDTNEYQIGYKTGREDGFAYCRNNTELTDELKQVEYTKGYNSAINDYNAMYEWLHDCFVDFKNFLLEKGFYTDEKFLDGFVVGQLMYDLICDHDIAEVISKFKKWQEEKKKADEIKVGDEVIVTNSDVLVGYTFIVMQIIGKRVVGIREDWCIYENLNLEYLEKTGRHYDEVEQLLNKLKGE